MRSKKRTRITVIVFGVFMSIVMVGSLLTGWLLQISQQLDLQRQQQQAAEPTPVPTFPPPVLTSDMTFERTALQANGLFSVNVPEPPNWGAIQSSFDTFANRARLLLRDELNVIEAWVQYPDTPVESLAQLSSEVFTEQSLGASWRNYRTWTETARTEITDASPPRLQMDFQLEFQNRTYVARQVAWFEGDRVYSVRAVTPENATELLVFMLDNVVTSFTDYAPFSSTPATWQLYYDPMLNHALRYPDIWQVTDSADGLPASIEGERVAIRVEALAGESVDDEDAAQTLAEALPLVTEVLSVEETERDSLAGYSVAYRWQNLDGDTGSGLVVMLNGDDQLHVANLRANNVDADLNAPEDADASESADLYANIMSTFYPLSGVELAEEAITSGAPLTDAQQQPAQPNFGF